MRFIVVVAILLLWMSPALAEQKTAPDGFGPIKFGMTKEEAWEAIGGEGAWYERENVDELVYDLELRLPRSAATAKATVHQYFRGAEGAIQGYAELVFAATRATCIQWSAEYAALIQSRYGVAPFKDSGDFVDTETMNQPALSYYTTYIFVFDDGVMFAVSTYLIPIKELPGKGGQCDLAIEFFPPSHIAEYF